MVILGTEYAGEMKKGVFTLMNYFGPKRGVLSMHCSATADANERAVLAVVRPVGHRQDDAFRRSRSGSSSATTSIAGRDNGIFNIEGGCYAKAIDLTPESEPEIFQALAVRGGAGERGLRRRTRTASISRDTSITQNTRGAYPIEFIRNAKIPCVAGHPTDVIFLTCDAFGVLPPVSRLSPAQAMYHFISGYTAKVAGTEMGVTEPQATFSPCFGGPFLVWHPMKYAELLAEKMRAAPGERLAGEHRLERRLVRRRQADEAGRDAGHHRRASIPGSSPRRRRLPTRCSGSASRRSARRAPRDPRAARRLAGRPRLRSDGHQAGRAVQGELPPVREGRPSGSRAKPAPGRDSFRNQDRMPRLLGYRRDWLRHDLVAGLSVAAVALPTAVAYAQIIGFDPVVGLYASILPPVVYALLGTSRHMIVNPDAATCAWWGRRSSRWWQAMRTAGLRSPPRWRSSPAWCASWPASAGWGSWPTSWPRPILVGFLNGVAIHIWLGQIGKICGFPMESHGIIPSLLEFLRKLPQTHVPTLIVGLLAIGVMLAGKRFLPRWPAPLLAVVAAVALAYGLGLEGRGVAVVGHVPAGLPRLRWPEVDLSQVRPLLAGARRGAVELQQRDGRGAELRRQEPLRGERRS